MRGIFNRSKSISTRLGEFEHEQFLTLAKAQKRTIADVLREAVIFYMDNYEQASAEAVPHRVEPEFRRQQTQRLEAEKRRLIASDYDDERPEPRASRWSWGD
jgi:hypothetical protein